MAKEKMYYIQDKRNYLGNSVIWWGKDQRGYTSNIDKAGKYTEAEARDICRSDDMRAWECGYIDKHITRCVDEQHIHEKYSKKWEER